MDRVEASQLANNELRLIEVDGYGRAAEHIDTITHKGVSGASGAAYDIEVSYHWEEESRESILVICSITSKSWFTHEKIEESITLNDPALGVSKR